MKPVKAMLIGAGNRGREAYAPYALRSPQNLRITAVAEPDFNRRTEFQKAFQLDDDSCFDSWESLLSQKHDVDAVIISTQDRMHVEPAIKSLEFGYHVLLEKPISPDKEECLRLNDAEKKSAGTVTVCHVLRYADFFSTLKRLLNENTIGSLMSIQHNENIGHIHFAHSFVRGSWKDSKESAPIILAKSCHDMDLLLWLADSDCRRVSSFGNRSWFRRENKPEGSPERCLEGCQYERSCPYNAAELYLTEKTDWPVSTIATDLSMNGRIKALKEGPYGLCVYNSLNNVLDHQVVNLEFENSVTASFTLSAFTAETSRTIKLMGSKGEIRGHMEKNEIEIRDFETRETTIISLPRTDGPDGHGNGDLRLMEDWVSRLKKHKKSGLSDSSETSLAASLQSHLMAFAAEESRLKGVVIDMTGNDQLPQHE
ncbi:MAG: gfo/Idh/MocA family oxidoreductase [Spirochaetes bacterium]|nr:MAG: gfo/Idh/MocA family oxidoreductase [Spirochaetota bacterium]